jgi:rhomboid protease GluP
MAGTRIRAKLTYNAPVVLTFAIAAVVVYVVTGGQATQLEPGSLKTWFVAYPSLGTTASYVGLLTHILGHASWEHLLGNFMLILLVGPMLEERYGSGRLLAMIAITALITGLANVVLSSHILLGASGVAFMMILLASTTNFARGEIPLTFVAVAALYLGGEVYRGLFSHDNISHMAHLVGGAAGAGFGFLAARAKRQRAAPPAPVLAPPPARAG